jgi:hypothetical protein
MKLQQSRILARHVPKEAYLMPRALDRIVNLIVSDP